jgi:hypothetical protein
MSSLTSRSILRGARSPATPGWPTAAAPRNSLFAWQSLNFSQRLCAQLGVAHVFVSQEMIAASGLDTIPQLQADGKYVGDADAVQQLVDEGSFGSLFSS